MCQDDGAHDDCRCLRMGDLRPSNLLRVVTDPMFWIGVGAATVSFVLPGDTLLRAIMLVLAAIAITVGVVYPRSLQLILQRVAIRDP